MTAMQPLRHIPAGVLDVAYFESGPAEGPAVFLMHGFPYDIHACAEANSSMGNALQHRRWPCPTLSNR
jgi:hypothetical protein